MNRSDAIGTRVSYEDQANPRRIGTITGYTAPGRFSGHYTVTWDVDPDFADRAKTTTMEFPALDAAKNNPHSGWRIEESEIHHTGKHELEAEAEERARLKQLRSARDRGIALAHWAEWDGELICEAFLAALTDANYHTLAAQLKPLIDADLNQPADLVVS